jgi:hypothetical protein
VSEDVAWPMRRWGHKTLAPAWARSCCCILISQRGRGRGALTCNRAAHCHFKFWLAAAPAEIPS